MYIQIFNFFLNQSFIHHEGLQDLLIENYN